MSTTTSTKRRRMAAVLAPLAAATFAIAGLGAAQATSQSAGHGPMEFGKTDGFYKGQTVEFTYTHGYYCDTSVPAASATHCEVGAKWKKAPVNRTHDPLYITVPLGFAEPMKHIDCPDHLTCVDHPATMDLTRLATALAPIFKTTPAALEPALRDFATPGHDHFLTDLNNNKPEWWDVYVVGVTSKATMDKIHAHKDFRYIQKLIKSGDKTVVGPIPTNLFLYFGTK
jgi:hypothetical protein